MVKRYVVKEKQTQKKNKERKEGGKKRESKERSNTKRRQTDRQTKERYRCVHKFYFVGFQKESSPQNSETQPILKHQSHTK